MKGCRPLTTDEEKRLANSFKHLRDRTWFIIGCNTGYRITELLYLQVGDVWQSGKIVDELYIERRNMKGKVAGRSVKLNLKAKKALHIWIQVLLGQDPELPFNTFLFRSQKGENKPITKNHAVYLLHEAAEIAGITGKLGTHSMRKTFAMNMLQKLNGDLLALKEVLGHGDIESTISYVSPNREKIRQAIMML